MPRSILVIGNGLGMALDSDFFSLDSAIEDVWDNPHQLTEPQKGRILRCISEQGIDDRPHGEEHLDILHLAVLACKFLDSIGSPDVEWLSADAQLFPSTIEKFITYIAWHFHHHNSTLPEPFMESLATFLDNTRSHIATLNYDNLLYQKLIELGILRGYFGPLVDGFYVGDGFDAEHLVRKHGRDFGYYLHLHGSPLFIDRQGTPYKQLQGFANEGISSPHLVLTHVRHKRSVIANSYLLTSYWDYLERGLSESDRIIIFGYSGLDTHLNDVLTRYSGNQRIILIEWAGAGSSRIRKRFWKDKLKGDDMTLLQLDNILEFTEWDEV